MVHTKLVDMWRAKGIGTGKLTEDDPEILPEIALTPGWDEAARPGTPEALLKEFHSLMGPIIERVLAGRPERYRPGLLRAWNQAQDLCLSDRPIEEILARDEGITEASSEQDRTRARDRLLQSQKRLREAMEEAIAEMESSGEMAEERADAARRVCLLVLKRRQTISTQPSKG